MTKKEALEKAREAVQALALLVFNLTTTQDKKVLTERARKINSAAHTAALELSCVVAMAICESISKQRPEDWTEAELLLAGEAAVVAGEIYRVLKPAPRGTETRAHLLRPIAGRYLIACKRLLPRPELTE